VSKILKFEEFSTKDYSPEQMRIFNDFYSDLASALGADRTTLSLCQLWANNPPPEAEEKPLEEFLGNVSCIVGQRYLLLLILPQAASTVNLYDSYHEYLQYVKDYTRNSRIKPIHEPKLTHRW